MTLICFGGPAYGPDRCTCGIVLVLLATAWHGSSWGAFCSVGEKLAEDPRIPLVSATGSVAMGLNVAKTVHGRLGKSIMELGGNNALIVAPTADVDLAAQSIFFGAVGTAGQRCTSTRRVIVHESVADKVRGKLLGAYKSLSIGNPLERKTLMGPLIDKGAVDMVQESIQKLKDEGGETVIVVSMFILIQLHCIAKAEV